MPIIHILAGPPGVGKSVNGFDFIPPGLKIIDQDDILLKYKAEGYTDCSQISAFKIDQLIKEKLLKDEALPWK
jgi:hypothetical protein